MRAITSPAATCWLSVTGTAVMDPETFGAMGNCRAATKASSVDSRQHKENKTDRERKVPPQKSAAGLIAAFLDSFRVVVFALRRHFHDAPLVRGRLSRRRRPGAELTGVCGGPLRLTRRPSGRAGLLPR